MVSSMCQFHCYNITTHHHLYAAAVMACPDTGDAFCVTRLVRNKFEERPFEAEEGEARPPPTWGQTYIHRLGEGEREWSLLDEYGYPDQQCAIEQRCSIL